jgi:hypothetical protein
VLLPHCLGEKYLIRVQQVSRMSDELDSPKGRRFRKVRCALGEKDGTMTCLEGVQGFSCRGGQKRELGCSPAAASLADAS